METRLNKFLAESGVGSRRKIDEFIAQGQVVVNGSPATLGMKIDPTKDVISINGKKIVTQQTAEKKIYLVLNKPTGFVTSSSSTPDAPAIVLDLLTPENMSGRPTTGSPLQKNHIDVGACRGTPVCENNAKIRVFPVGRLDRETTGLLILTNDGDLTYRLTHPKFACEKEYEVVLGAPLTPERIRKIETGIRLDDRITAPARVIVGENAKIARIIVQEGRYRQIRRVCEKVGCEVVNLKRLRINRFVLPKDLPMGRWRQLTFDEVKLLSDHV